MADAGQYRKIRDIILANPERKVAVVSAAGKRSKADHKITDLLYLCYAHTQYGVDCSGIFEMIRSRYLEIREELNIDLDLDAEFEALKKRIDSKSVSQDELVSRGEYFSAKLMAAYLGYNFVDAADWVKFNMDGTVDREASYDALRHQVDVLMLLSHMGHDRDYELLARENRYDLVVSAHTHEYLDTVVCGTQLGQTYKDLRNVGATTIRLKGRKVVSVAYENILTTAYAPDSACLEAVNRYYADEELNRPIGHLTTLATKEGLANWFVELMKRPTGAEVGFYHIGGVRLDTLAMGGVGTAAVYDLEPFSSRVAEMQMTPDEMRRMLITKYNEPTREGHRIDLHSTTPYTIVVNDNNEAVDVKFPTLKEGREYRVAISDYAFKNYQGLVYREGRIREELITDLMLEALRPAPVPPDNRQHATILTSGGN